MATDGAFRVPAEAALHELVEQAPHILPLAGNPRLVVIGREVLLGANWADLVAVEPSGRLVILEIKLARNAEARRAVVAQILTYAAYLRGMDPVTFERDIVGTQLRKRGYDDLAQAVLTDDQEGPFDGETYAATLATSLREGRFRLLKDSVNILDVVALTTDQPDHALRSGEVVTVVEILRSGPWKSSSTTTKDVSFLAALGLR